MKNKVLILFPNQLYPNQDLYEEFDEIVLIEEFLFFRQYNFHKMKLVFHRASMQHHFNWLSENFDFPIKYVETHEKEADIRRYIHALSNSKNIELHYFDTCDEWLQKRIQKGCLHNNIDFVEHVNPSFLNNKEDLKHFFKPEKKSYFQTTFYKQERKKRNILLENGEPKGGKWTYDVDNRKKYPKNAAAPEVQFPEKDKIWVDAESYIQKHFANNYGEISNTVVYPYTRQLAINWFHSFLNERFEHFGDYEDAIVNNELILNHSVLTPMLNIGLLLPQEILSETLNFAKSKNIPLNSTEGFVRQIMGWREFIRGMYLCKGNYSRTKNYWNFERKIPSSFYSATTGIKPIDDTIRKTLKTGYCHHIERLMVLGNFMLLCEIHPDDVYQWFMEMFIDSYDWVMVPNVYGMSQFADGGTFATKPYISSSNYILKMSNYGKGDWQETWDGLFWRFMDKHRDFFVKNPRLKMLINSFDKMPKEKQLSHIQAAEQFLENLN